MQVTEFVKGDWKEEEGVTDTETASSVRRVLVVGLRDMAWRGMRLSEKVTVEMLRFLESELEGKEVLKKRQELKHHSLGLWNLFFNGCQILSLCFTTDCKEAILT